MSRLLFRPTFALLVASLFIGSQSLACTIFCFTHNGKTYFCNNEDWRDPVTKIRFNPRTEDDYAWVYLGFDTNWAQGGVNEHGLCFDWVAGGGPFGWKEDPNKKNYSGNISEEMLRKCKNVKEAIAFLRQFNYSHFDGSRTLIGDKEGNSAFIGFRDGEFFADRNQGPANTCGVGKKTIDVILKKVITNKTKNDFDVEDLAATLMAARSEGDYPTQYSNIISLSEGKIILYRQRRTDQCLEIDFASLLEKPTSEHLIADLFDGKEKVAHIKRTESKLPDARLDSFRTGINPITIKVNDDAPRKWTITPKIALDTLEVECKLGEKTTVTFESDIEKRTFEIVGGSRSTRFFCVLPDGTKALTGIATIKPKTR